MNFSTAINAALKLLRANGQSIDDSNDIFIHAIDGKLIVAAPKGRSRETIAVVMPFPFKSDRVICGTFSARLRKLFTSLRNHAHQITTILDSKGFHLVIKGASFRYRIDLKGQAIKITKAIDLTIDNSAVHCAILSEEITTENNTMQLITTNNYFADLATAVEANLFTRDGKNPKKADLYLAIDAHNAQLVKAPEVTIDVNAVEVQALPTVPTVQALPTVQAVPMLQSTEAYDTLRRQWAENKTAKSTRTKVRAATATATVKDCTYTAKATKSNPSKKIVELIEMLTVGTTKEAICQAFQWKSWNPKTSVVLNYGYNLQMENGIYSIAK